MSVPPTSTATYTATYTAPSSAAMMPLTGLMVRPFPEPAHALRAAMEQLQFASTNPPESEEDLRRLATLPRPWDPGTCTGRLRSELWRWLDQVASWLNEQHLWNLAAPGIPECWPAHPHLTHDLAVVACARYYTTFAVNPGALEDWHRSCLPMFLDRLNDRVGDGCQPGKHMPRPRNERDHRHTDQRTRRGRHQRYTDDVERTHEAASGPPEPGPWPR